MERWAIATGFARDSRIWNGGTLPLPTDDVYANGFTVTIDTDTTLVAIHTDAGVTAVAGGGFILGDDVTLTANVIAGATTCIIHTTTAEIRIVGNVTGSLTTSSVQGVANNGNGTVTVTGNVIAGNVSLSRGILNNAGGRIHVNGNAIGGDSIGILNVTTGVVVINGDAIGGSGAGGIQDGTGSTGRVFVLGTVIGGPGSAAGVVGTGLNPIHVYRAKVGSTGASAVTGKVVFFNPGATTYEIKDATLTSKVLKRAVPGTTTIPLRNRYKNERRYTQFVQ